MVERNRDDPPIFYIPTQLAGHKYHALLIREEWVAFSLLTDLSDKLQVTRRQVEGEYAVRRPRGLYGFQTVEERDKFIRRCNAASDAEDRICYPVTVPNVYMDRPYETTIRYQPVTAPVMEPNKETPNA